jgi:hypothetical protein
MQGARPLGGPTDVREGILLSGQRRPGTPIQTNPDCCMELAAAIVRRSCGSASTPLPPTRFNDLAKEKPWQTYPLRPKT